MKQCELRLQTLKCKNWLQFPQAGRSLSFSGFVITSICLIFATAFMWLPLANADGMPAYKDNVKSSAMGAKKSLPTLSSEELLTYQYCGKDSDCMAVINGCCQCLQGGTMTAIAKNRFEAFRSNFSCDNVQCDSDELAYQCEEGVVSCIKSRCTYIDEETLANEIGESR